MGERCSGTDLLNRYRWGLEPPLDPSATVSTVETTSIPRLILKIGMTVDAGAGCSMGRSQPPPTSSSPPFLVKEEP